MKIAGEIPLEGGVCTLGFPPRGKSILDKFVESYKQAGDILGSFYSDIISPVKIPSEPIVIIEDIDSTIGKKQLDEHLARTA